MDRKHPFKHHRFLQESFFSRSAGTVGIRCHTEM